MKKAGMEFLAQYEKTKECNFFKKYIEAGREHNRILNEQLATCSDRELVGRANFEEAEAKLQECFAAASRAPVTTPSANASPSVSPTASEGSCSDITGTGDPSRIKCPEKKIVAPSPDQSQKAATFEMAPTQVQPPPTPVDKTLADIEGLLFLIGELVDNRNKPPSPEPSRPSEVPAPQPKASAPSGQSPLDQQRSFEEGQTELKLARASVNAGTCADYENAVYSFFEAARAFKLARQENMAKAATSKAEFLLKHINTLSACNPAVIAANRKPLPTVNLSSEGRGKKCAPVLDFAQRSIRAHQSLSPYKEDFKKMGCPLPKRVERCIWAENSTGLRDMLNCPADYANDLAWSDEK